MPRISRAAAGGLFLAALGVAQAAEPSTPIEAAVPPPTRFEGAIGLNTSYGSTYQGASGTRVKLTPGFFLRYGRLSITNSSGYVTRRADDVLRGVALDLSRSDTLRVNLSLRFDQGRSEGTDDALAGLGDIKRTVRLRASATQRLDDGWRLGASWSLDAFGRGGGNFGDIGFAHEQRWSPDTVWTWGASLTMAGDRYMQTYYGISAEQAARTNYAIYTPSAGLRDVAVFANMRSELSPRWVLLAGVGASHLLGPAADSPLTKKLTGIGVNAGLAWRF